MADRLKQAAFTALVALLLGLPFIGLTTLNTDTGLAIDTRWGALAILVSLAFMARLAGGITLPSLTLPAGVTAPLGRPVVRRGLALAIIGLALALPFLPFSDRYVIDQATKVLIYLMLGAGLNVTVGLAGLLDLGFVAFFAIGAYATALLTTTTGLSFWLALPLSGLIAALVGVVLAFPILRLRGDYLAIVTLGFGEITRIVIINWQSLTGGPNGVLGIPQPSFFDLTPNRGTRLTFLYYIMLALLLLANLAIARLRRLPIGRAWEALREDEIACRSLGIDPRAAKVSAYATGALLGGIAGALFATKYGFVSPDSFTFLESAMVLAIVVLGGLGSQWGVVIAGLFLVLLPEIGRGLADYRMLLFGLAMILVMIWRPGGLLSAREPTIRLNGRAP